MADDIFSKEDALNEGATNVVIDDLAAAEGELSVEQLRKLVPDGEEYSDEDIAAAWAQAQKTAGQSGGQTPASAAASSAQSGTTTQPSAAVQRAWKLYGQDDKEVADFKGMTAEQFLAAKIGYTANKAEQKKTLDELIRVAQYGHLNEQRFGTTKQERDQIFKELETIRPQYQTMQQQQKQLLYALDKYIAGDQQPLRSLVEGYAKAISERNAPGQHNRNEAAPAAAVDTDNEAAGMKVYYERVVPAAETIAKQYNLQRDGVAGLIMQFVDKEPAQFVTAEKLQQIIEYDVPQYIEQQIAAGGVQPVAPAAQVSNSEIDALRKEIAALKAGQQNAVVDGVRNRNRRLPPAASGGGTGNGEFTDTGMKAEDTSSAAAFKRFLKS